jgi:hypothetical protein
MARNSSSFYHASATIPVLITVTFSTPTGVSAHDLLSERNAIVRQCHLATKNSGKTMKKLKFGGLVEFCLRFLRPIHTLQQLRMELQVTLEGLRKLSPAGKFCLR